MAKTAVLNHPLVHGKGPAERRVREATCSHLYREQPQLSEGSARTWLTRAANFVIAVSEVDAGSELKRVHNPDEYFVLLPPDVSATISAGAESIEARGDSLTIVPPGASVIRCVAKGRIVRVFSKRAEDLCGKAANAGTYSDGAPEVAPLIDWPEPVLGYRLRNYDLPNTPIPACSAGYSGR